MIAPPPTRCRIRVRLPAEDRIRSVFSTEAGSLKGVRVGNRSSCSDHSNGPNFRIIFITADGRMRPQRSNRQPSKGERSYACSASSRQARWLLWWRRVFVDTIACEPSRPERASELSGFRDSYRRVRCLTPWKIIRSPVERTNRSVRRCRTNPVVPCRSLRRWSTSAEIAITKTR